MYVIIALLFGITVAQAQLLVLELEQTRHLPSTSTVWDVIPDTSGDYLWVQANRRDNDSLVVYWGHASSGEVDSFNAARGYPKILRAFWREGYAANAVLSWWNFSPNPTWSDAQVFRLSDGAPDSLLWSWGSWSNGGLDWQQWADHFALVEAVPVPGPPMISENVIGAMTYRYEWRYWGSYYNAQTITWKPSVLLNMLAGPVSASLDLPGVGSVLGADIEGDTMFVGYAGDYFISQNGSSEWRPHYQTAAICDGVLRDTLGYWTPGAAYPSDICCTYDEGSHEPIAAVVENSSVLAYSGVSPLWSTPGLGRFAMAVDAIPEVPGEEIVYYSDEIQSLKVHRAGDGYDFGHSTALVGTPTMIRVVSRDHEATRRLAVQSGWWLRLYRIAEYLDSHEQAAKIGPNANLAMAYPNPFNSSTTVSFDLPRESHVLLNVFDITGRSVATLADGIIAAGTHDVTFDASALPSGVYVYRMQTTPLNPPAGGGRWTMSRKLVVLK